MKMNDKEDALNNPIDSSTELNKIAGSCDENSSTVNDLEQENYETSTVVNKDLQHPLESEENAVVENNESSTNITVNENLPSSTKCVDSAVYENNGSNANTTINEELEQPEAELSTNSKESNDGLVSNDNCSSLKNIDKKEKLINVSTSNEKENNKDHFSKNLDSVNSIGDVTNNDIEISDTNTEDKQTFVEVENSLNEEIEDDNIGLTDDNLEATANENWIVEEESMEVDEVVSCINTKSPFEPMTIIDEENDSCNESILLAESEKLNKIASTTENNVDDPLNETEILNINSATALSNSTVDEANDKNKSASQSHGAENSDIYENETTTTTLEEVETDTLSLVNGTDPDNNSVDNLNDSDIHITTVGINGCEIIEDELLNSDQNIPEKNIDSIVPENTESGQNHYSDGGDLVILEEGAVGSAVTIPVEEIANRQKEIEKNSQPKTPMLMPVSIDKLMDPVRLRNQLTSINVSQPDPISITNTVTVQSFAKKGLAVKSMESSLPNNKQDTQKCSNCNQVKCCTWIPSQKVWLCRDNCINTFTPKNQYQIVRIPQGVLNIPPNTTNIINSIPRFAENTTLPQNIQIMSKPINSDFIDGRKCIVCRKSTISLKTSLSWEGFEYCSEDCLASFQSKNHLRCSACKKFSPPTSLSKYGVRFGLEIHQFCTPTCLDKFKKGLKSCSYCQINISNMNEPFSHIVGSGTKNEHRKDFCSEKCKEFFIRLLDLKDNKARRDSGKCTVCSKLKEAVFEIKLHGDVNKLCSDVCSNAFKFANKIDNIEQCKICRKYVDTKSTEKQFIYHNNQLHTLCDKKCLCVFITFEREITSCSWCKVNKYSFDMLKKTLDGGLDLYSCSLSCLKLSLATLAKTIICDYCTISSEVQYYLTMKNGNIRLFCSYKCAINYQQINFSNIQSTHGGPKKVGSQTSSVVTPSIPNPNTPEPVLRNSMNFSAMTTNSLPSTASTSNVQNVTILPKISTVSSKKLTTSTENASTTHTPQVVTKCVQQIILKPNEPKQVANKKTQCNPLLLSHGTMTDTMSSNSIVTQTDDSLKYQGIIPIPVPIYIPVPVHMYTTPYPVPVPYPMTIPVPIFIPTTQQTFKGLKETIKKIIENTPEDPLEADILRMAELAAAQERDDEEKDETQNGVIVNGFNSNVSDDDDRMDGGLSARDSDSDELVGGDTIMATPENSHNSQLILISKESNVKIDESNSSLESNHKSSNLIEESDSVIRSLRSRKRSLPTSVSNEPLIQTRSKKQRNSRVPIVDSPSTVVNDDLPNLINNDVSLNDISHLIDQNNDEPTDLHLKYKIGISGWNHFILSLNEELKKLSKGSSKRAKLFELDMLKIPADQLNSLLCKFLDTVRQPDGNEYSPDTLYYFCLCIQYYMINNDRIDNIFFDVMYNEFTDALNAQAEKFMNLQIPPNIRTRVDENHLWESKQLGCHSPIYLLVTLMYFNTKFFKLATLEDHLQLSIVGVTKQNVNSKGISYRYLDVRLESNTGKKSDDCRVYRINENKKEPLKCPVKLYEFYLSKCPESVQNKKDVFYLQPEVSCVSDSPIWYSTEPLDNRVLYKILNRILMLKEINIALFAPPKKKVNSK